MRIYLLARKEGGAEGDKGRVGAIIGSQERDQRIG